MEIPNQENVTKAPSQEDYYSKTVSRLQSSAKEKVMFAGSLVAQQVSLVAAQKNEEEKMADLMSKLARLGGRRGRGRIVVGEGGVVGAVAAVATQTENLAVSLRETAARLRLKRDGLAAAASKVPRNCVARGDILRRRNELLLAREERALLQARDGRQQKEKCVAELREAISRLTVARVS